MENVESAGWDPYNGTDPGAGIQRLPAAEVKITPEAVLAWEKWRTNDGRIPADSKSSFEYTDNPFEGETGNLVKLITYFDPAAAGRSFGGFGIRAPLSASVEVHTADTYIEFDLYYPFSAAGKYMRLDFWSTDTDGEGSQSGSGSNGHNKSTVYIRTESLDSIGNLNPVWVTNYNGETWSKKQFCVNSEANGTWNFINIDINTETGAAVKGELLLLGNIKITKLDKNGVPIPHAVDKEHYNTVTPIKEKYNKANGLFMVGSIGAGKVTGIRERHYEIFTDSDILKPQYIHPRTPQWLRDETGFNFAGFEASSIFDEAGSEYNFPTKKYLQIRDSGKPGEYKCHGHVLAWFNQASVWMRQIIPENLGMNWNKEGKFYAYGNNAAGPFIAVNKNMARRVYFNHIMYVMRHFMTTDAKYASGADRGIIPFHSFDVLNEEIHESRHSILIRENEDEWKSGLKSISWLAAMTDDDFDNLTHHYIYLLFKYAHIAVPNSKMAEKFKANYACLPEYMKIDGHDKNGSIDAYITENPPLLTYNEYGVTSYTKAKITFNMLKELNTLWLSDPLYDERPLIEVLGIQGHDSIGPTLAGDNERAIKLFSGLIDQRLLSKIAYSELDIKLSNSAPGGGALAPDILNQKQADALGYQYALLYKMFAKYAKYIDHVISWGIYGSGWQGSYVLFNSHEQANQGYYGVMDPDRFIKGHSYLDEYFNPDKKA